MMRLCRACGEVSAARGDCPWCGSASVYAAEKCEGCGGAREAKDLLCEACAAALRKSFSGYLRALTAAERAYLVAETEYGGLEEFFRDAPT